MLELYPDFVSVPIACALPLLSTIVWSDCVFCATQWGARHSAAIALRSASVRPTVPRRFRQNICPMLKKKLKFEAMPTWGGCETAEFTE